MKNYTVVIETKDQIVSEFKVQANSLKEAKMLANRNKRMEHLKGRTSVKLSR